MTDTEAESTAAADTPPRWAEYMPLDELPPAAANPKRHATEAIKASIRELGYADAPILDERTGRLIGGHGRTEALAEMHAEGEPAPDGVMVLPGGRWAVSVQRGWTSRDDDAAESLLLAVNRLPERGGWDQPSLDDMLTGLASRSTDLLAASGFTAPNLEQLAAGLGRPLDPDVAHARGGDQGGDAWDRRGGSADEGSTRAEPGRAADPAAPRPTLADRFLIPPFDVLDGRQGWWQTRKKQWLALGIRSEVGRSARALGLRPVRAEEKTQHGRVPRVAYSDFKPDSPGYDRSEEQGLTYRAPNSRDSKYYGLKADAEAKLGRPLTNEEFERDHYAPAPSYESGTSIFDPVLCELAYRWFCPPGGHILDPFAGGSVRGLMAAMLGRRYTGNDLRREQTDANEAQAREFGARGLIGDVVPQWHTGDSAEWVTTLAPDSHDFLWTCPPYLWLERYSDDPADLSRMKEDEFTAAYSRILAGAAAALRQDRYAAIVVGDVREQRTGRLVDFRGITIAAGEAAGLVYQSSAAIITPVGSLAVRAGRTFSDTRTLGRTHQHLVLFCKGDRRAAATACGDVDVTVPDAFGDEPVPMD